jgi:hypothetical protein
MQDATSPDTAIQPHEAGKKGKEESKSGKTKILNMFVNAFSVPKSICGFRGRVPHMDV